MIVVELSDNRGVLYSTITKGGIIMTGTSKAITGASKKVHSGSRMVGKTIKKYPKSSSAVAGASLMAFLDD